MAFIHPAQGAELQHLTPRPTQTLWGDNYLSFDSASGGGTFAQQFLPEIYEKEVERYGKRTISGFLKLVGAEMPLASDQVIWSEQGRLHIAYAIDGITVRVGDASANGIDVPTGHLLQNHDTIIIANAAQTKVSGVILYKNEDGTATLGTDLKIYFTCNGGTNWTESTPAAAGTFSSGILMAKCPEVTCTSGTDVRYKAVWANQSAGSKETQLHGIGMNY